MKRYIPTVILAAALGLAGCHAHVRQGFAFPHLDDLSADTQVGCPAIEQVTGALGDLALKDTALAEEYAACQKRFYTVRSAYLAAQHLLAEAAAKADANSKGSRK